MEPELEVVGRHAMLFDDDATAAFVNSKDALIEWNSLFIDRFDVRHLLSNPPSSFRKLSSYGGSTPIPDSHLESEIDLERYSDLPSSSDDPEIETEVNATDAAGYHSVPFSYNSTDQKNPDVLLDTSAFHPPFHVPESLVQNLPPTEKVHQIIARTAMFVGEHGSQSEIVLRVKQGDNPTFGFLMPHHHLHPYFRYLVDHLELLKADNDGKSQEEKTPENQTGGALSLLGSVYGSGEDEDGAAEILTESKQIDYGEASSVADMSISHPIEQTVTPGNLSPKDEIASKLTHPLKVKPSALSKSRISSTKPGHASGMKKEGNVLASTCPVMDKSKASTLFPVSKVETSLVDPPSEIKRLVDRIVEIILKNGKHFEAILIEQDKKQGRFQFLLPSNQYHPYYLKVLKKAQESRLSGKGFSIEKDSSSWQEMDKNTASMKENDFASLRSDAYDLPLDDDRKEKFKMVIGKLKKDSQDLPSKETRQQCGITVDAAAAAAILQAATRGIKKPSLSIFSKAPLNGANHDSSNVSYSSSQKQKDNGKASVTVPVAKEIAETAALAAASEADSSEAGLTREQKLKAERLRRAKMFAAMIKSGADPLGTEPSREPSRGLSVEPPGSGISGSAFEVVNGEVKEGEKSPVEAEARRKNSDDENVQKSRKRRHYRSRKHDDSEGEEEEDGKREDDEVEEEDGRRSRRKHRSHHRDRSKDRHKHRRKHSSSKSKETRHRHKHESSSSPEEEDERHHRHKQRHKHDSSSEDERKHRKRKHKHSRKDEEKHKGRSRKDARKSHSEEAELEEGEIRTKSSDQSPSMIANDDASREASVDVSKSSYQEKRTPSLSPSETTEVPDELRAKIRAMLLATM